MPTDCHADRGNHHGGYGKTSSGGEVPIGRASCWTSERSPDQRSRWLAVKVVLHRTNRRHDEGAQRRNVIFVGQREYRCGADETRVIAQPPFPHRCNKGESARHRQHPICSPVSASSSVSPTRQFSSAVDTRCTAIKSVLAVTESSENWGLVTKQKRPMAMHERFGNGACHDPARPWAQRSRISEWARLSSAR